MTNFADPRPYIGEKKAPPAKHYDDKAKAIREAIKIIRANKIIVDKGKTFNENPHR
jgi:hypothetical protein